MEDTSYLFVFSIFRIFVMLFVVGMACTYGRMCRE